MSDAMVRTRTPTTRRASRSVPRARALVPEYSRFVDWQRPMDHLAGGQPAPGPRVVPSAARFPQRRTVPLIGRLERALAAIALGLIVVVWPLQIVVVAVLLGGAWLIDDAMRDVVPGHARRLRRALRPIPWLVAACGVVATFVWPDATALVALEFLGVAAVLYLCCEGVAVFRAVRHPAPRPRPR